MQFLLTLFTSKNEKHACHFPSSLCTQTQHHFLFSFDEFIPNSFCLTVDCKETFCVWAWELSVKSFLCECDAIRIVMRFYAFFHTNTFLFDSAHYTWIKLNDGWVEISMYEMKWNPNQYDERNVVFSLCLYEKIK